MDSLITLLALSSLLSIIIVTTAVDTITTAQFIRDGNTTVSAGGRFELGFFSPNNSKNRYVGIWYKSISDTVVWVANREAPLVDSSGVLKVTQEGVLVLLNSSNGIVWSCNSSGSANNPVAKLLESGNLVLKDADDDNPENFLWQSFDYPSDTFLPGMKFGWDIKTGLDNYLWSWRSRNDPARGDFIYRMDPNGYPQYFMRKDSVDLFRSGPWNGLGFSGMPRVHSNPICKFRFVLNQKEMYSIYELLNSSVVSRMVLTEDGILQRITWMEASKSWAIHYTTEKTNCDAYAVCGVYGLCTVGNSPECDCLDGFTPKSPKEWAKTDWSNGCVRRTPLDCNNGDGFKMYSSVKVPDTRNSTFNVSMTLKECEMTCLKNCSCTAYANLDISAGGSGCLLWFGDLVDIREFSENGQDLFVRMAASELGQPVHAKKKSKAIIVISLVSTGTIILGLGIALYTWKKQRRPKREGDIRHHRKQRYYEETKNEDLELPLFDLATITTATNNFAINNKLGEGGFGPVYKVKV